jgi:hypothetical protein
MCDIEMLTRGETAGRVLILFPVPKFDEQFFQAGDD